MSSSSCSSSSACSATQLITLAGAPGGPCVIHEGEKHHNPSSSSSTSPQSSINREHDLLHMVEAFVPHHVALSMEQFAIVAPVAVPQAIFQHVFAHLDITSDTALMLAAKHQIHPENVLRIARIILSEWKRGSDAAYFVSVCIRDITQDSAASTNNMIEAWIADFRLVIPYEKCGRVINKWSGDDEMMCADLNSHVYRPDISRHPKELRTVIVSYAQKKTPRFFKAWDEIFSNLAVLDTSFVSHAIVKLQGFMTARLVHSVFVLVIQTLGNRHNQTSIVSRDKNITFYFPVEKRLRTVTFASLLANRNFGVLSVRVEPNFEHMNIDKFQNVLCKQCKALAACVRCEHCHEQLYCSEKCRVTHFGDKHSNECEIYPNKKKVINVPGGPKVTTRNNKMKK